MEQKQNAGVGEAGSRHPVFRAPPEALIRSLNARVCGTEDIRPQLSPDLSHPSPQTETRSPLNTPPTPALETTPYFLPLSNTLPFLGT